MVSETHALIEQRKSKLDRLREEGVAFPNDFRPEHLAQQLHKEYDLLDQQGLEEKAVTVSMAGRMMLKRVMGKASFCQLQDRSGQMQVYVRRDDLPDGQYEAFKLWDLGDIIGVEGEMYKTNKGELSIKAKRLVLLTKALRPLPDKHHGLNDPEACYRQRYLDLIVNKKTRSTFQIRSKVIQSIRHFLMEDDFIEVETPMLHIIPGGATAKPFITHHHSLSMDMYLRIAPELHLKRLIVGGLERVFEINRNFRNEGLSTRHNPEFTTLEFYQAYADYNDLMDLTERLLQHVMLDVLGAQQVSYQGETLNFEAPFARMTMLEAVHHYHPEIAVSDLQDEGRARAIAKERNIALPEMAGLGRVQTEIFEETTEHLLIQPTFITAYPAEVSPLARRNDEQPELTDRFEMFCAGREIANGFSELNDAEDQAARFKKQVEEKAAGDDEAMHYDDDYVIALEHGMPPTAGEGIGIDRLVMLLTDSASIKDVILFPHMRPVPSADAEDGSE